MIPVLLIEVIGSEFWLISWIRLNLFERVAQQIADKQNKQPKLIISIKPVRTSKNNANKAVKSTVTPTPNIGTWFLLHLAILEGSKPSRAIALNILGCPTIDVNMVNVIVVSAQTVTM